MIYASFYPEISQAPVKVPQNSVNSCVLRLPWIILILRAAEVGGMIQLLKVVNESLSWGSMLRLLLFSILLIYCSVTVLAEELHPPMTLPIVKKWERADPTSGYSTAINSLNRDTIIYYQEDGLKEKAEALAVLLRARTEFSFKVKKVTSWPKVTGICLKSYLPEDVSNSEAYSLDLREGMKWMQFDTDAGFMLACDALFKLVRPEVERTAGGSSHLAVNRVKVEDWPDYPWRGMSLDVASSYVEIELLKRYIDKMRAHQLNRLTVNFTNRSCWRIESKKYPLLTQGVKHYTQQEIKDLVAYGAVNGVAIVPVLSVPQFPASAAQHYPEHLVLRAESFFAMVNPLGNKGWQMVDELTEEFAELFPSTWMQLGQSLTDRHRRQVDELDIKVLQRQVDILKKNNKVALTRLLSELDLPEGIVVVSNQIDKREIELMKKGHPVVMEPRAESISTPHWDAQAPKAPRFMSALTAKNWLEFRVKPEGLDKELEHLVLGVNGITWLDKLSEPKLFDGNLLVTEKSQYIDYISLPQMAYVSRVGWSKRSSSERRFPWEWRLVNFYESKGYGFRLPVPKIKYHHSTDGDFYVYRWITGSGESKYTRDGSLPDRNSDSPTNASLVFKTVADLKKFRAMTYSPQGLRSPVACIHIDEIKLGMEEATVRKVLADFYCEDISALAGVHEYDHQSKDLEKIAFRSEDYAWFILPDKKCLGVDFTRGKDGNRSELTSMILGEGRKKRYTKKWEWIPSEERTCIDRIVVKFGIREAKIQ